MQARRSLPLLFPIIGWITGLLLFYGDVLNVTAAWNWQGTSWLLLPLAILLLSRFWQRASGYIVFRVFILCFCFACLWAIWSLYYTGLQLQTSADWLQGKHSVHASVLAVTHHAHYTRLTLQNIQRYDGIILSANAFAYVRNGNTNINRTQLANTIQVGDVLQLLARWRLPYNHNNPGDFDYLSYCFDRNIALLASVSQWRLLVREPTIIQKLRTNLLQQLQQIDNTGILATLLLANKTQLDTKISAAFAAAGIAHLLAISGLHIGMVALWAGVLCWWCMTRKEVWIIHFNVQRWCLVFAMLATLLYASLAGWPLPTQRAVLMFAATVLAWWLRARTAPINTMLAALWLITLWHPAAVISISLWLSFSASLGLLIYANVVTQTKIHPARQWFIGLLAISAIASIATLPWIAHVFHQLALYSLLANLIFVPLYTLLVLPLALLATLVSLLPIPIISPVLADTFFAMASWLIAISNELLLFWYKQAPASHLWLAQPPLLAGIALLFLLGLLAYYSYNFQDSFQEYQRWFALVISLGLVMYGIGVLQETPPKKTMLVAWDVGQGAAASLLLPDGFVLCIDAPGDERARYNGGTQVASGLQALGLVHANIVLLSHAQRDHMGGLGRLIDNLRFVNELWLADVPENHNHAAVQRLISKVQQRGGFIRWLHAGMSLPLGKHAVANILWPPNGFTPKDGNQNSLIISIIFSDADNVSNKQKWLFSGDAGRKSEYALLRDLQVHDGVLMPHHGSNTANSAAWLRAVKPKYAIAQTGKDNHFGFPRPVVLARYAKIGTQWWNTANGAVIMNGNAIQPYQKHGFSNRHATDYAAIYLLSVDTGIYGN